MPHPLEWLDDALAGLDRRGLRRQLSVNARRVSQLEIERGGQSLINFGSNDYLGLASHPKIAAAAKSAIDTHGWGAGASPLVTGRGGFHAKLETALANFEGTEAALLFPTGYAANVGTITALVGKGDAVYSDELNHASIIDGCRLSRADVHVYRHLDVTHLEQLLSSTSSYRRRLIVTDSLFSMHGDYAPLADLAVLAQRYSAMLMVDEAHATGIFGKRGRGCCERDLVEDSVHLRIGTLSKALGSMGGFAAASKKVIDWLANRARPYIFSTAAPGAVAAAGLAALEIVHSEPYRAVRLLDLAGELHHRLARHNLIASDAPISQILPVIIGQPERAVAASAELRRRGFFVPAIRPPSVPLGQSLLRISLTSSHTSAHIDSLITAVAELLR